MGEVEDGGRVKVGAGGAGQREVEVVRLEMGARGFRQRDVDTWM